jgi:hypothetical protein
MMLIISFWAIFVASMRGGLYLDTVEYDDALVVISAWAIKADSARNGDRRWVIRRRIRQRHTLGS